MGSWEKQTARDFDSSFVNDPVSSIARPTYTSCYLYESSAQCHSHMTACPACLPGHGNPETPVCLHAIAFPWSTCCSPVIQETLNEFIFVYLQKKSVCELKGIGLILLSALHYACNSSLLFVPDFDSKLVQLTQQWQLTRTTDKKDKKTKQRL